MINVLLVLLHARHATRMENVKLVRNLILKLPLPRIVNVSFVTILTVVVVLMVIKDLAKHVTISILL